MVSGVLQGEFDSLAGERISSLTARRARTDCYAGKESGRRREPVAAKAEKEKRPIAKSELWWIGYISFADLLKFMVERDGLTADQIAMNCRCGPASKLIGGAVLDARLHFAAIPSASSPPPRRLAAAAAGG